MRHRGNKYSAVKQYSELCGRQFDSKAECRRGEELALLQINGEISELQYQVTFKLCAKPSIKIKTDFVYQQKGHTIYEDVKGYKETKEFRIKRAWLLEQQGINIILCLPPAITKKLTVS